MKVNGPGQISNVSKSKGTSKSGGDGSFSKMLDSADNESEVQGVGGISKLSAINFIQEVNSDEKSKRQKLVDEADELLDELGKIRDALLSGNLSVQALRNISAKIEKIEANCDDPNLNEIIDEVKTRAAVELAKLGF